MLYLSKIAQEKTVYNPAKSTLVEEMVNVPGVGAGVPIDRISPGGGLVPSNNTVVDQQSMVKALKEALSILNQLYQEALNIKPGQPTDNNILIEELAKRLQITGNQSLQSKVQNLRGIYESNPYNVQDKIMTSISTIANDINRLLAIYSKNDESYGVDNHGVNQNLTRNGFMNKNANLKETIRQHFNNFPVSDIQIISKLQFLHNMLNVEPSPPEEPKEYTRPEIGEDDQPSILHGTGAVDGRMSKDDIKNEITKLRKALQERGYTDQVIDECVSIINTNQRTQVDVEDDDYIGSREGKGISDREEQIIRGLVRGDEQVVADVGHDFIKMAQAELDDYEIKKIDEYTYKVRRRDGFPLTAEDERIIEGAISEFDGYDFVFIALATPDDDGYYTVHVGRKDDARTSSRGGGMKKIAALPGMTIGPTTAKTVWCPKTKEPMEEYVCWNICIDGIKVGDKVVCGKRIFDAMVADSNERALHRTTVYPHNSEHSLIPGPTMRIPDNMRRREISDDEIPIERRLQELHEKYPVPHDTTTWTHSPTLSDDKKHDWSQEVKIASNESSSFYERYLDTISAEGDVYDVLSRIAASIPVNIDSEQQVNANEVFSAVKRAVDYIEAHVDVPKRHEAYMLLLKLLDDFVFSVVDESLGRQMLYYIYWNYPQIRRAMRSSVARAYTKYRMLKSAQRGTASTYRFPDDLNRFYEEVTFPRFYEIVMQPGESFTQYASRLIDLIEQDEEMGCSYTPQEAVELLAAAIPYPTSKQFIPVMNMLRDYLNERFGADALRYLAREWVFNYWHPTRTKTDFYAFRHIKRHFPEVIGLFPEFDPDEHK